MRALDCRFDGIPTQLPMSVNVLTNYNRIIHDDAERHQKRKHRQHVQRVPSEQQDYRRA